jgi:hypothetical protein
MKKMKLDTTYRGCALRGYEAMAAALRKVMGGERSYCGGDSNTWAYLNGMALALEEFRREKDYDNWTEARFEDEKKYWAALEKEVSGRVVN